MLFVSAVISMEINGMYYFPRDLCRYSVGNKLVSTKYNQSSIKDNKTHTKKKKKVVKTVKQSRERKVCEEKSHLL